MPDESNEYPSAIRDTDTMQSYPTLAHILDQLETWSDLSDRQRARMRSPLRMLMRLFGLPAAMIVMSPAIIGPKLEAASPAACGLSTGGMINYKTQIRTAMRRVGLIDLPGRSKVPLSRPWSVLRDSLPDHHINIRLQDFMAVCDQHGIAPSQVDEHGLHLYATALRDRRLTRSPAVARAKVIQAWNKAVGAVPGWPERRLTNPATRVLKTIPPDRWTRSFADDVARFVEDVSAEGERRRFSREVAAPILRPATIRSRLYGIRVAVTVYAALGNPVEELVSFDQLLVPETMEQIIEHSWKSGGKRLTGSLKQIGDTLRCMARYRHPEDSIYVAEARRLAKAATPPKQKGLSKRTEDRLMQFLDQPIIRAALLHLPSTLLDDAQELKVVGQDHKAAWKAATAAAIAIELRCPLRLHTLTHLRMGEELSRVGGDRARWTEFTIGEDISKTKDPLRWPIGPSLSLTLDRYINEFRPLGPHGETAWLFPARDTPLTPRAEGGLSHAISHTIYRYTGAEVHVHLFRAFAGMLILEDNPDALDDLRRLLGHATLDTALRHYAFRQHHTAAARVDAVLERKSLETEAIGRQALAKWHPRRRPSGKA